jgi:hypothetical protein
MYDKCPASYQSKWANIKNRKTGIIQRIHIDEYLHNKELQKKVISGENELLCNNGHLLTKYESNIRSSHFKHLNSENCCSGTMSDWHSEFQGHFKNTEVIFPKTEACIKERHADAVVKKDNKISMIVEFQHSYINTKEVQNREHDYNIHDQKITWIIDGNQSVECIYLLNSNKYLLIFSESNDWKYESFMQYDYIYINIGDKIFRVEPNKVKCRMIEVSECKLKHKFIDELNDGSLQWSEEEIVQCTLSLNQRGAGCGKTYESIQLLSTFEKYSHKKWFIYLTKVHSAKDVIYKEFNDQVENNKVSIDVMENGKSGKQYSIKYKRKNSEDEVNVIMGTIDSFIYALGDKNNIGNDFFGNLMKSINEGYRGYSKNGSFQYSKNTSMLNKECQIIIDEAQDLDTSYIKTIAHIMRDTYIDVHVIGDKLQSIWGKNNVFTYLETNELPYTNIERNIGDNIVKRFHNSQFVEFVNSVINYEKFALPKITGICDAKCSYEHENHETPYTIQKQTVIMPECKDLHEIHLQIKKYLNYMDKMIKKYNYLPHNFMFIFPIMKNNILAQMLETSIQKFWTKLFGDKDYKENVLKLHPYWKTQLENIENGEYFKFSYLHMSEDNKPINTEESKYATRLLTIHASKGMGCEVVFLLNLSQKALECFNRDGVDELRYESLLHVAITRQKKHLYIGYTHKNDDIHCRLMKFVNDTTINFDDILPISEYSKSTEFSQFIKSKSYQDIHNQYISEYDYDKNILDEKLDIKKKDIIDWGHHGIRYNVMFYQIIFETINNQDENIISDKDQILTLMKKISNCSLETYSNNNEYYSHLHDLSKRENCPATKKYQIPILDISIVHTTHSKYCQYVKILQEMIKHIQSKLNNRLIANKLPKLCPMEMVVIIHLMSIMQHGIYSDISIMILYDLLYIFDHIDKDFIDKHHDCNCICKNHLGNAKSEIDVALKNSFMQSICNHYNLVLDMQNKYQHFLAYIKNILGETMNDFEYHVQHNVMFKGINDNFILQCRLPIISNSTKHNILFLIKPEISKLNIADIMLESLVLSFIVNNSADNNSQRYKNKKTYVCIFSCTHDDPIWLYFDLNDDNALKECMKSFIVDKYSKHNNNIFELFQYCKDNRPKHQNSFQYFNAYIKRLKEEKGWKRKKPYPQYIDECINYHEEESRKQQCCTITSKDCFDAFLEKCANEWLFENVNCDY